MIASPTPSLAPTNRRPAPAIVIAVMAVLLVLRMDRSSAQSEPAVSPFHIGFSVSTLGDLNRNDAMAAVRIWAEALRKTQDLPLDPQPIVVESLEEMRNSLAKGLLDAINLTTDEYWRLRPELADDAVLLGVQQDSVEEEFVLLVHRASGYELLPDLRGKSLLVHESPRVHLAPIWLRTTLADSGLGIPTEFWGRITTATKLTRAVLPVFFRQADACLAARRAFATLVEMNPQVGRDLRIVARSPAIVPYIFAFRAGKPTGLRARIIESIGSWHTTVPGRQILTMFQCDRIESRPASVLDATLRLLEDSVRLAPATPSANPPTQSFGRGEPSAAAHLPRSESPSGAQHPREGGLK